MEVIVHRVNNVHGLRSLPRKFGAEIDIRAWGSELILNHEPLEGGDRLVDYLDEYRHGSLVLNIKETGVEDEVLRLVRERSEIRSYFLLDVEFPYLFRATQRGEKAIAVRFSEAEPIESVEPFVDCVDWVWIDTITCLPVSNQNIGILSALRTCLVCPSLWKRPQEIDDYRRQAEECGLTAVMTEAGHVVDWEAAR
jgi:hypothetical protein